MPHTAEDDARNVVLNDMNKPFTAYALDAETMARWEHIIEVRTAVNGAVEEAPRGEGHRPRVWRPTCI